MMKSALATTYHYPAFARIGFSVHLNSDYLWCIPFPIFNLQNVLLYNLETTEPILMELMVEARPQAVNHKYCTQSH